MDFLTQSPRLRRIIASLLLGIHLTGCTSWAPVSQPVPEAIQAHPEETVRLTLSDGRRVELTEARVVADSIVGLTFTVDVPEPWNSRDTVAYALADIRSMSVKETSAGKTVLLVGGIVLGIVAVVAVAWAIECAGESGEGNYACP